MHNHYKYRLILHLDIFLKASSGHLGQYIGLLLQDTFKGPSFSLKVKQDNFSRMLYLLFANGKESDSHAKSALLTALMELLVVSLVRDTVKLKDPPKEESLSIVDKMAGFVCPLFGGSTVKMNSHKAIDYLGGNTSGAGESFLTYCFSHR